MDQYAVIGNPVQHSLSPQIHTAFAEQTGEALEFIRIETPIDSFIETLKQFQNDGGKGVSITMPFKHEAFKIADEHSETAHLAEAANMLILHEDGSRYAHNTDGKGFVKDLTLNYQFVAKHKKILLLGAGGAAHGIIAPLLDLEPKKIIIANRTKEKSVKLAEAMNLRGNVSGIALDELPHEPFDLIINSTSASAHGANFHLPSELINESSWCYDLMYGDAPTPFLAWGKQHGAEKCIDGIGMLVEQAAEAFFLWRNVHPDTSTVIESLR